MMENQPTQPANKVAKESDCQKESCDSCMKGGMPLKRETLSFVVILLVGLVTALAILLINEKRNPQVVQAPSDQSSVAVATVSTEEIPVKPMDKIIDLPQPSLSSNVSVEETLANRRSRRVFSSESVSLDELSQILWSGQGITDESGHRTAASAKGAYPYTIYVVVRDVEDLDPGLYQYMPKDHQLGYLGMANAGDLLSGAGVQDGAQKAPVVMLLSASYGKMKAVFPENDPVPNTLLEAGHIGQNIYLQVEALDMSTVVMGGFNPVAVGQALGLHQAEEVIYLIPVGHRSEEVEESH